MPDRNDSSTLRSDADDLCYRMRRLAGTGDLDAAAALAKDAIELINDASAYDRTLSEDDDDYGVTLSYCLEMAHLVMDNIAGIAEGNRSRTARQAA